MSAPASPAIHRGPSCSVRPSRFPGFVWLIAVGFRLPRAIPTNAPPPDNRERSTEGASRT